MPNMAKHMAATAMPSPIVIGVLPALPRRDLQGPGPEISQVGLQLPELALPGDPDSTLQQQSTPDPTREPHFLPAGTSGT